MKIRALALVTALALPMAASADPTTPNTSNTAGAPRMAATDKAAKLSTDDVKIVSHLHHVNQMEIDLGKWAKKTASAPGVKTYGESLITDHTSADKDLTAFAKKHGLSTIPADKPVTDAERTAEKDMTTSVAKLKTLKAAEFDREFLSMMAADHDKELAKIDTAMGSVADADLKTLLTAVKPVLQRHADQARDLQKNSPQASTTSPPGAMQPTSH